jgi:hypothetical protein
VVEVQARVPRVDAARRVELALDRELFRQGAAGPPTVEITVVVDRFAIVSAGQAEPNLQAASGSAEVWLSASWRTASGERTVSVRGVASVLSRPGPAERTDAAWERGLRAATEDAAERLVETLVAAL